MCICADRVYTYCSIHFILLRQLLCRPKISPTKLMQVMRQLIGSSDLLDENEIDYSTTDDSYWDREVEADDIDAADEDRQLNIFLSQLSASRAPAFRPLQGCLASDMRRTDERDEGDDEKEVLEGAAEPPMTFVEDVTTTPLPVTTKKSSSVGRLSQASLLLLVPLIWS
eukprot:Blabericola_migrator_1__7307@NODE_3717_length_1557_cov_84_912752_g2307_i0_p1_GENE_NODE_3717_length_1557_cov_84_912752_g2307_i0NODE_3717_length_1557_cov_84_912752_g2307_i0_p1_ORF_typecomplete_len169_score21_89_NODE_3717_length_1557_cov_84_912752_g2307_i0285791